MCNFLKNTPVQVFSSDFCDVFKNNYLVEQLEQLKQLLEKKGLCANC